jgi:hypothetical protein
MLVFVKMVIGIIVGIQSKTIFDISAVSLTGLTSAMSHESKGFNMDNIVIFKQTYGDDSLSGNTLTIKGKRKDGKYSVIHTQYNGKRLNRIYTVEQLQWAIFQMERQAQEQSV